MKKLFLLLICSSTMMLANAVAPVATPSDNNMDMVRGNEGIVLINDTPNQLKIHTGSGEVTLNARGGRTSFSCNIGKSVKADGKVIFKVTAELCGKTIKLSEYL